MKTLRNWLYKIAYPDYKCQECVGQDQYLHGCYCMYYDAYTPGGAPPPWYVIILRKLL